LSNYLRENGADPLNFVGKFNVNSNYLDIVTDIRKELGLTENWASHYQTWEKSLEHLTEIIEDKGIIINYNGVVGNNNQRTIEVKECRGFVMVDDYAPFLFVNSADAKAAQMFTIVHELAHIWLGASAGFDFKQMQAADDPVEKLCDQIAAEFLVAERSLKNEWQETSDFKNLAKHFKVSPIVIGRRALDIGLISRDDFFSFYNTYIKNVIRKKAIQGGGGNFYNTAKKRVSLTFAAHVNNAVNTNSLLYRDAYRLTGLKGGTYTKFLTEHNIN
jgi:Zn-dependent peptidase ImmA (M78 family)